MNNEIKITKEDFIKTKTTPISKEYILGKTIGTGAFGQVRLAVHKATKQKRAVKILKKANQNMSDLLDEVSILSKLTHPNIMQIYEVFDDKTNFYIVSEFCKGGELFEQISEHGSFSERDASVIMKQLLSAICYSHQNGIVHRDLKPENILLDDKKEGSLDIKLIDWGCAKKIKKDERLHTSDGTPYYIAPEVLKGDYDERCDVWSCGVIMYILLCGYPPFNGETDDDIFNAVLAGAFDYPEEEWSSISNEAKNLINKMLVKNVDKRLTPIQCMEHPWFKNNEKSGNKENKQLSKNILKNMKKFKKGRKLEQATIGFIVNQLINKEERKELKKQFQDWDKNGDGVLNREEILDGYKKAYGIVDENEIDNMIKSVDMDGNGVIDYNEFLSCAINKDKIMSNDNLKLCFQAFDSDGSGKLSLDELMMVFSKSNVGNKDKEAFEKIIKEADDNGDGEISFQEFRIIMDKFFS